jgi:hypothetical protein
MSWHMNVKVDEVLDDGDYEAVLDHIDQITTNFQGEEKERLKWVFRIPDKDDIEIVGSLLCLPPPAPTPTSGPRSSWARSTRG